VTVLEPERGEEMQAEAEPADCEAA
jgi:hypothetical protein